MRGARARCFGRRAVVRVVCWEGWMVGRFVFVIRVPVCALVSRVSCPCFSRLPALPMQAGGMWGCDFLNFSCNDEFGSILSRCHVMNMIAVMICGQNSITSLLILVHRNLCLGDLTIGAGDETALFLASRLGLTLGLRRNPN